MPCFLNPSGLSRAAQEYYKLFSAAGFRVIPIWLTEPTPEGVDKDLAERMMSASGRPLGENPMEFYVGLPHALRLIKNSKIVLGSCVFENNSLTKEQIRACRSMTAILVPSMFCYRACLASGIPKKKVFLLPYPLDSSKWNYNVQPKLRWPENMFRFLFMNSWYERKGWDVLLRAWWSEFSKNDPVELCIKSYREDDRPLPIEAHIANYAAKLKIDRTKEARIRIIDGVIPDEELPSFMKSFDCLVSPHRSEGFGMQPWYAMAMGIPVICTNYGGVTDFAKEETSWLVDPIGMSEPSQAEVSVFPHLSGISWAEPDAASIGWTMRVCTNSTYDSATKSLYGLKLVHEDYSPWRVMAMFQEVLEKVAPWALKELNLERSMEALASQPSPRHEEGKAVRMMEV